MTAIVLPNDLQDEAYEDQPRAHGTLRSGVGYAPPKIVPHDAECVNVARRAKRNFCNIVSVRSLDDRYKITLARGKINTLDFNT